MLKVNRRFVIFLIAFIAILAIAFFILYRQSYGVLSGELTIIADSEESMDFEIVDCTAVDYKYKKCRLKTKRRGDTVSFSNEAGYGLYLYSVNVYIKDEVIPVQLKYMKANNRSRSDFSVEILIEDNMGKYDAHVTASPYGKDMDFCDILSNPIEIYAGEV
ncbi:MAG: hypothetical protein MJ119_04320 [Lachnospiraceae bacterium]|nr:hypothetical protein [Lachnospiraceae bacterium]